MRSERMWAVVITVNTMAVSAAVVLAAYFGG